MKEVDIPTNAGKSNAGKCDAIEGCRRHMFQQAESTDPPPWHGFITAKQRVEKKKIVWGG
jgi:hypothetical protein